MIVTQLSVYQPSFVECTFNLFQRDNTSQLLYLTLVEIENETLWIKKQLTPRLTSVPQTLGGQLGVCCIHIQ